MFAGSTNCFLTEISYEQIHVEINYEDDAAKSDLIFIIYFILDTGSGLIWVKSCGI